MTSPPPPPDQKNQIFTLVDVAISTWGPVVVPIYGNVKRSGNDLDAVGSAFLVSTGLRLYLVTALHVLHDIQKKFGPYVVANISGKGVSLAGVAFEISNHYDVAVAHLSDEWLAAAGLESGTLKAFPMRTNLNWSPTGLFLLLGYPATKNLIKGLYGKTNRHLYSISTSQVDGKSVSTQVENPLIFDYDHENVVNSEQKKLGPQPNLRGMSGGPALQLLADPADSRRFSVSCEGVLSEWPWRDRAVVASSMANVCELISRYEKKWVPVEDPPLG